MKAELVHCVSAAFNGLGSTVSECRLGLILGL